MKHKHSSDAANARLAIARTAEDMLWRWAAFAERYWWAPPDAARKGCFGTGYQAWGVQTNQKYVGAMAVLAARAQTEQYGFTRRQALDRAVRGLRYSLSSHVTGDYHCSDGTKWGRTWISSLGIERMMHGIDLIYPHLHNRDRRRLREVLTDEADFQLTAAVHANLWNASGQNMPESNIWNGAACARAALRWPRHRHAKKWLERATCFWLNGISTPADASDSTVIDGKPISQWHAGANFFPSFALDHHGYLNTGYMVICLSNIAMMHYACLLHGWPAPPALYHHAANLWHLVKRLVFPDGRLARIGGDTRIRYCYCQDYLIPALIFAADYWADPHAMQLLAGAVELARLEQAENENGSFHGRRLAEIERLNPYYYTRLESDKACVLSMAVQWLRERSIEPPSAKHDLEQEVAGGWVEHEHGAAFHRCPTRLASWSWRAADPPQGLCVPPSRSNMAEWNENLAGAVEVLGANDKRTVRWCRFDTFDGGFITMGSTRGGRISMQEGFRLEDGCVDHHIVFAALPDGHTAIQMELALLLPVRASVQSTQGVKLELPNDVFNGRQRLYTTASGQLALPAHEGERQAIHLHSRWVNVDGVLGLVGVYGATSWHLLRRGRQIGGKPLAYGSILSDALCFGIDDTPRDLTGPAVLLDGAAAILASVDAAGTRAAQNEIWQAQPGGMPKACRAVVARGRDRRLYLLAANFGDTELSDLVDTEENDWADAVSGEHVEDVVLPPWSARLYSTTLDT